LSDHYFGLKKHQISIVLSLFFCLVFLFILPVYAELTGLQIIEKQKELHKVKTEYGEELMLLVETKNGNKEQREVKRYSKETGNDLNKYLLVFLKPADIRSTALLTHENNSRDDDQWLYMPAVKKMKRIAASSKKSYFMGTDFTYEDMEPEDIDNFTYRILKTEIIGQDKKQNNCYVIEAVPANKEKARASAYSKRILWIEKEVFITLKVEFYDRRERLIKTQNSFEFKNIEGTVYRPGKIIMDNIRKKHKTLTLIKKRVINQPVDDVVFTERFILNNKHVN